MICISKRRAARCDPKHSWRHATQRTPTKTYHPHRGFRDEARERVRRRRRRRRGGCARVKVSLAKSVVIFSCDSFTNRTSRLWHLCSLGGRHAFFSCLNVYGTIHLYCLEHGRFLAWAKCEGSFDFAGRIVNKTLFIKQSLLCHKPYCASPTPTYKSQVLRKIGCGCHDMEYNGMETRTRRVRKSGGGESKATWNLKNWHGEGLIGTPIMQARVFLCEIMWMRPMCNCKRHPF